LFPDGKRREEQAAPVITLCNLQQDLSGEGCRPLEAPRRDCRALQDCWHG